MNRRVKNKLRRRERGSNDFGSGRGHLLRSVPTLPLPPSLLITAGILYQWDGTGTHARNSSHLYGREEKRAPHQIRAQHLATILQRGCQGRTVFPMWNSRARTSRSQRSPVAITLNSFPGALGNDADTENRCFRSRMYTSRGILSFVLFSSSAAMLILYEAREVACVKSESWVRSRSTVLLTEIR